MLVYMRYILHLIQHSAYFILLVGVWSDEWPKNDDECA